MKKNKIFTWLRNIVLIPLLASIIWLVSKGSRILILYNSTMLEGGRGVELSPFTKTDIYILILFVISLTLFLIFNKIKKKHKVVL